MTSGEKEPKLSYKSCESVGAKEKAGPSPSFAPSLCPLAAGKRDRVRDDRSQWRVMREERFLSAQADPFTGVKGQEKIGLLRSK